MVMTLILLAGFKCGFLAACVLVRPLPALAAAGAAGAGILLLLAGWGEGRAPLPGEWALLAAGLLCGFALVGRMRRIRPGTGPGS